MRELAGKDGVVILTDSCIRLRFAEDVATGDKIAVSPRDIPLTSIDAVDYQPDSGFFSGSFRLVLHGDSSEPRGRGTDINTVLTSSRAKSVTEWEAFTKTVSAAISAAVPKVPLNEQPLSRQSPAIRIERAMYLGGLPGTDAQRYESTLTATGTQIGTKSDGHTTVFGAVAWGDCVSVTIDSSEVSKSRVAATILFGVAGLATKGRIAQVILTATKRDGSAAVFAIADAQAQVVTATLAPLLRKVGVPILSLDAAPMTAEPISPLELLERLGKLRDAGVVTEEEFAEKKRELLDRI